MQIILPKNGGRQSIILRVSILVEIKQNSGGTQALHWDDCYSAEQAFAYSLLGNNLAP